MGVLTDFFIATDAELFATFRGWKRPAPLLDECITMTAVNPFTGKSQTIRTRISPEQPAADGDAVIDPDFRAMPWIDQKGIQTVQVVELATILLGWDADQSDCEIHGRIFNGPEEASAVLCEMPPALVARLADLHSDDVERLGREWSDQMSEPDAESISRLSELSGLAKRAIAGSRGMFLWMSP